MYSIKKIPLWVLVIAALILLRFFMLDYISFWRDEIYSATASSPKVSIQDFIFFWTREDVHPPLLQILLFGWQRLGFTSDYALSALPFTLSTVILCTAVWRMRLFLSEPALGYYALLLFGIPVAAWAALELRSYAIVYALAALSWPFFLQAKKEIDEGGWSSSLYPSIVIAGIGSLFHYFFLAFSGAQLLILLYCLYRAKQVKNLVKLCGLYLLGYIPVISWLIFQSPFLLQKSGGHFWIKNRPLDALSGIVSSFVGDPDLTGYIEICTLLALLFLIRLPWKKIYREMDLILWHMLIFFIGLIVVCWHTPIVTSRNIIVIIPSIVFCLSKTYQVLIDQKIYRLSLNMFLFATILIGLYQQFFFKNEEWRSASQYIVEKYSKPDCEIPVRPWMEFSSRAGTDMFYEYYLPEDLRKRFVHFYKRQESCDLLLFSFEVNLSGDEAEMTKQGINFRVVKFGNLSVYEVAH